MGVLYFYPEGVAEKSGIYGSEVAWTTAPTLARLRGQDASYATAAKFISDGYSYALDLTLWVEENTKRPLSSFYLARADVSVVASLKIVHRCSTGVDPTDYTSIAAADIRLYGTGQTYSTAGTARNTSGVTMTIATTDWTTTTVTAWDNSSAITGTLLSDYGLHVVWPYKFTAGGAVGSTVDVDQVLLAVEMQPPLGGQRMGRRLSRGQ